MASLFDQYEQATARESSSVRQPVLRETSAAPVSSGYVTATMEEDVRIFTKNRINFTPPKPITHMAVNNNILIIAMRDNQLLRIDREHPDQPDEVKVGEDRIHRLFLDPTGRHLLISTEGQEVLSLSRNSRKCRNLTKCKGHLIDSVGWNKSNTNESSTSEILLGTSQGLIYEAEIQAGEDSRFFHQSLDQYFKQVFNLGKEGTVPVTAIEVERIPASKQNEGARIFVMATTPGRLYQFIGTVPAQAESPIFLNVFQKYEEITPSFLELPGNFGYSKLEQYCQKSRGLPATFAWMTGPGVYFGGFDFSGQSRDNLTKDSRLLPYPVRDQEPFMRPIAIILTEFHVLLLFQDRVKILCVLNEQLIDEDVFQPRFGRLIGMCRDRMKGTIWTYTDQSVFMYKVVKEARDVWRIYLDKGDFDRAKEFVQDNPAHLDQVMSRQAEHFFDNRKYEKSAIYYAMTEKSFEEISLKFIEAKQTDALKVFLMKKLGALKTEDKTQLTMLVMWLIELNLNQLGALRGKGENQERFREQQDEFQRFLATTRVMECLNSNVNTVYDLIASHGDVENMVYFAMLMQDFERVIRHHIQNEDYIAALDVLRKPSDSRGLFYKFSPVLMQHIPHELVSAWIEQGKRLEAKRLIPSLVQCDSGPSEQQVNEAIRYLEFCIGKLGNKEQAIHNYLLSLYCQHQPSNLMGYLARQGEIADNVNYDLKYALRLCAERNHFKACVHIYTTMGLYEEAVDLAIKVDVELAKQSAEKPDDDEVLRRKLWLRIAKHVVSEQNDIKKAMAVLQECPLLKIEDILPFFPDFVTIDHFKDAICSSLADYNQHIEALKADMEDASESAKALRADIQETRNKYGIVSGQQKCASCNFPLLTRSFYLFPCEHMFHADCLITEVQPHLIPAKRIRMSEIQSQLSALQSQRPQTSTASAEGTTKREEMDRLRNELDDIVAAECVYCGDIMIGSIDKPFIDRDQYEAVMKSWE
ncbi:vacuolar protein sorting-associated protein 18 homolog [Diadema antillarum]|uniref:vacuolar protein sorting-associated protein 18 homolog n=1 Tax=Diadema antillarum TaxID=105358 RepID=UPI003A863EEC